MYASVCTEIIQTKNLGNMKAKKIIWWYESCHSTEYNCQIFDPNDLYFSSEEGKIPLS